MAAAIVAIPVLAFAAADQACKIGDSGAMSCSGTIEANEKRATCQPNDKIGYKPGCPDYPAIAWTVAPDGSFYVIVNPAPAENGGTGRIKIRYQLGQEKPQNFACRQDEAGAFLCDISTQFVYLKCAEKPPAGTNIVIQAEIAITPDKAFQNPPATFGLADLKAQICDARAAAKAYNAQQQGSR